MKAEFTFLIIMCLGIKAYSQPIPTVVNIKSPEVNAFNRFIETPVSQYSGVPSISIPLYEIQIKGINIPITLDYHAGGIRVDQDATWVGLGWNINYGGQVTRKSRGVADEFYYLKGDDQNPQGTNYFMNLPNLSNLPDPNNMSARYGRISDCKYGNNDYMPDEFYYSLLGYSGRFMFSQSKKKFLLYPKEDIDVFANLNGNEINSLTIKLPSGVTAELGEDGYSKQAQRVRNTDTYIKNSWMVKRISNNYNETITYNYENFQYKLAKIIGQQYKIHSLSSQDLITSVSNDITYDSRIKTITFSGGRIEFLTDSREDMPSLALKEIKVFDEKNNIIKHIKFNYSYFYGDQYEGTTQNFFVSSVPTDYRFKRLKLDQVSILADNEKTLNYNLDYNTSEKMPSKYAFSQDHWGYYNGIPNLSQFGLIPNLATQFTGGDRRVNPELSKLFALKSIVYPEGGKTEFIYENNTAGVRDVPTDLLATYQDDNFIEKSESINISGWSRASNYPAPDQIINKVRYFKKRFNVSGVSFPSIRHNWKINTNFGISNLENNTDYYSDNVEFTLNHINDDGSKTLVKRFNTTDTQFPYGSVKTRNGIDSAQVPLSIGEYEMIVAITYANSPNTPADLQPYNLGFSIYFRQLDETKSMVNVGGLRVKNINHYDNNNLLIKRKRYEYLNPDNPNFTSGKIISFPQYLQYRIKEFNDSQGRLQRDWIINYTSSSVVPLETTSGSYAGYEYVNEYDDDLNNGQNSLKTAYHFSFERPYYSQYYPFSYMSEYEPKEYMRGKLLDKISYIGNSPLKKEEFDYNYKSPHLSNVEDEDFVTEINTDLISWQGLKGYAQTTEFSIFPDDFYDVAGGVDYCVYFRYSAFDNRIDVHYNRPIPGHPGAFSNSNCQYIQSVPYFKRTTGFDKISKRKVTLYNNPSNPTITEEIYNYDKTPIHHQISSIINNTSKANNESVSNLYALDEMLSGNDEVARQALIGNHDYLSKLSVKKISNDNEEITKTLYQVDQSTNLVLPKATLSNTGVSNTLEERELYNKFDKKANVLEIQKKFGLKISYLYSYDYQHPIAEIKNADHATIEGILGSSVVSDISSAMPTDAQVKYWIDILRNSSLLKDAYITSYTFNPLVGMTSMTDPKGMTTTYEYDGFGRLKWVKDQNGNILKENTYHYKN